MSCGNRQAQVQKSFASQNRMINDDCAYQQRLHESTSPLMYQINPMSKESCTKCHMSYPGFIGALGGFGPGTDPNRVDISSDLRGQTRLSSRCPSHKYNPHSYRTCGACKNCDEGLPCGCMHCRSRDVSHLQDCRPGIIPIESIQTRVNKACNPTTGQYINRMDYLCSSPQDPKRIFNYPGNRRLGAETRMDFRDYCGSECVSDCGKMNLRNKTACQAGSLGCRKLDETGMGVYN